MNLSTLCICNRASNSPDIQITCMIAPFYLGGRKRKEGNSTLEQENTQIQLLEKKTVKERQIDGACKFQNTIYNDVRETRPNINIWPGYAFSKTVLLLLLKCRHTQSCQNQNKLGQTNSFYEHYIYICKYA